jgi:hypothetical protein
MKHISYTNKMQVKLKANFKHQMLVGRKFRPVSAVHSEIESRRCTTNAIAQLFEGH